MTRHDTILIACADNDNRRHLRITMEGRYNLLEAVNIQQAVTLMEQNMDSIAAVLLATSVMTKDGIEILKKSENQQLFDRISTIVITEDRSKDDPGKYFYHGVDDVVPVDYDPYAMTYRISNIINLHLHRHHLQELYSRQEEKLRASNDTLVDALSTIIEYRNTESGQHIKKIRNFTKALLGELMRQYPDYGLSENQIAIISSASSLHDIGKIAIPDSILTKPGPLTKEEMELMKTHTVAGCDILKSLSGIVDGEYLNYAYNICRYHHERRDGAGYPEGLKGDEIPICAQVVGMADAYEALTATRSYKEAYSPSQAANMIIMGECGEFSSELIECFKRVTSQFEKINSETGSDSDGRDDFSLPEAPSLRESEAAWGQAKYNTLVHYVGGLLVEVNLDSGTFHVVYNPYPTFINLSGIKTQGDFLRFVADEIVVPEQQEEFYNLFRYGVYDFVDRDMRRASYTFRFKDAFGKEAGEFELTLLRTGTTLGRRSFAALAKIITAKGKRRLHNFADYPLLDSAYICRNDGQFTLATRDARLKHLGGYSLEEIQEKFGGRLIEFIHPDDRGMVSREFEKQLFKGSVVTVEHRVVLKSGDVLWVVNKSYLEISNDGTEYLHCFLTNINETRTEYERIKKNNTLYKFILGESGNILFDWDARTDVVNYSDTYHTVFGFEPTENKLSHILTNTAVIHPDDAPLLLDALSEMRGGLKRKNVEIRLSGIGGQYIWCRFRGFARFDENDELAGISGICINIDEEKQDVSSIILQAEKDPLTGLLNKTAARTKSEEYLSYYPDGVKCAMVIIDIDDFKQVNDTYGHLFGDSILMKVAAEIKNNFAEQDIISRIGGDEFLVLVRGISERRILEELCNKLLASLSNLLNGKFWKSTISCSIGVALSPEHGTKYYQLFDHADKALYMAKYGGKNCVCFYDPDNREAVHHTAVTTAIDTNTENDAIALRETKDYLSTALSMLYASNDAVQAVNSVLRYMGEILDVSRVYIFENTADNRYCNNTFEWCNTGITPEIANLQNVSYEYDIPGYLDSYDDKGVLYSTDISTLPENVYRILQPQGIKSLLHCLITQDGVQRGYVGFDECTHERLWTKEEIRMLTYLSNILGMYLNEYRKNQQVLSFSEDMRTILENQNSWVYIIDPDSYEIKYINRKASENSDQVSGYKTCHKLLFGNDRPCQGCPAVNIRQKGTEAVVITLDNGADILAEATMITWQGKESCLMTSRRIPAKK